MNYFVRFIRLKRFSTIVATIFAFIILCLLYQNYRLRKFNVKVNVNVNDASIVEKFLTFYLAVVSCDQRFGETLVMIKSALLFNRFGEKLHFLIFTEEPLISNFREKLNEWRNLYPNKFDFELLLLKFPTNDGKVWHNLFKPCAAQRLFLPSILKNIDALLYVDTDIIFLTSVGDIWQFFNKFNASHIAALCPEHEDSNIGWYNRFARHPYYGRLGVNSGVMLMNLTRMREFNWEQHILPIHKQYKLRITWGDQDIINILFYYYPEKLFVMPCEYNYRPDHCMYMSTCNTTSEGIKLIHGNRGYFHSNKQPLFRVIYEVIESYQFGADPYNNVVIALRNALNSDLVKESNCGKMWQDVLLLPHQNFFQRNVETLKMI